MSIAILMYTVVTKLSAINDQYPGGLEEYVKSPYVWHDDYIVGSSFMSGNDVDDHIEYLIKCGIAFDSKQYSDIAIVDQRRGILTKCDWLEFRLANNDHRPICWLTSTMPGDIVLPQEIKFFEGE